MVARRKKRTRTRVLGCSGALVLGCSGALVLAAGAWMAAPYVAAAAFVIDLSGRDLAVRRWLPARVRAVHTRDVAVETRYGHIAGRVYQPEGRSQGTLIVVPGLHPGGVDEPRLSHLTTRLAATGRTVVSLPLPDLRDLRITPRSTDMIEDAVMWVSRDSALAPDGRVSLIGISFGGGLALVAAGRPGVAGRIDRVVSFGGHGDLPRVIRYVCTGLLPDGTVQPAHDYSAILLLLGALPHLVPADQVAPLERAIRVFLEASMAGGRDAALASARRLEEALPEPARAVMRDVRARDASRIGLRLLPLAETLGGAPALSPERSPAPRVPVFLVHGAVDDVIPHTETPSVAAYLERAGTPRVEWLLTPTISHADATTRLDASSVWALVRFWVRMWE